MEGFIEYNWIDKDKQPKEDGLYLIQIPNSFGGISIVKDEWVNSNFRNHFRTILKYKRCLN